MFLIDMPPWFVFLVAVSVTLNLVFIFWILPMKNRTLKFWADRYRYMRNTIEITQLMQDDLKKLISQLFAMVNALLTKKSENEPGQSRRSSQL